jgi:hypothetical protein
MADAQHHRAAKRQQGSGAPNTPSGPGSERIIVQLLQTTAPNRQERLSGRIPSGLHGRVIIDSTPLRFCGRQRSSSVDLASPHRNSAAVSLTEMSAMKAIRADDVALFAGGVPLCDRRLARQEEPPHDNDREEDDRRSRTSRGRGGTQSAEP